MMKQRKASSGYHVMTKEDFDKVRTLADAKLTSGQIAKVLKISTLTASHLMKCQTWEEWVEFKKLRARQKQLSQVAGSASTQAQGKPTTTATGLVINRTPVMSAYEIRMANLMTELVKAVEELNQSWLAEPKRKGLFG